MCKEHFKNCGQFCIDCLPTYVGSVRTIIEQRAV